MSAFEKAEITMLCTRFVPGGEAGVHAPVLALLEPWPTDVHYQTFREPSEARLRTRDGGRSMTFNVMVYDLDAHGPTPATEQDFVQLVVSCTALPHPPSWVSRTKNGAHLLYVTTTLTDPATYQATRATFGTTLTGVTSGTPYDLDPAPSDWTRTWRAPRVLRSDPVESEDGGPVQWVRTDLRDARVEILHENVLDVTPWITTPKPTKRAPKKRRPQKKTSAELQDGFDGSDRVIRKYLRTNHEGERNRALFGVACWTLKRYEPSLADDLLELLAEHAQEEGLSERETNYVLRSARRTVNEETE